MENGDHLCLGLNVLVVVQYYDAVFGYELKSRHLCVLSKTWQNEQVISDILKVIFVGPSICFKCLVIRTSFMCENLLH